MKQHLAILVALVYGSPAFALGDFYVDASAGVDVHGAGTEQQPFRTVTFALQFVGGGLHTIHVAPGVYDAAHGEVFPLRMNKSVSVVGAGTGTTRVVGAGIETLVEFDGSKFGPDTRLANLTLENAALGVRLEAYFSDVGNPTLEEVEILGMAGAAITVFGSGSIVEPRIANCRVANCGSGVRVSYSQGGGTTRIEDSRFDDCEIGVRFSGDGQIPLNPLEVTVERCEFRGCGTGVYVTGGDSHSTLRVSDSLVVDGVLGGQSIHGFPSGATLELHRCTVAGNEMGLRAGSFGGYFLVRGSIVRGNARDLVVDFLAGTGFDFEWSNAHSEEVQLSGTNVDVDPQFVSAAGDYRLSATSPMIDAGDPLLPPGGVDRDGDPRLTDGNSDFAARVDMGYDEFNPVHLDLTGTPAPGQTLTLDVQTPAGWVYFDLVSAREGDVSIGALGSLLCSPVGLLVAASGAAPGSDSVALPPNPNLSGVGLCFQSVGADLGTGAGSLSNRVGIAIE